MRKELVAEPFALRRSLHETSDVYELHRRRDHTFGRRVHNSGDACEARIGDLNDADVGLDGAEWIVRRIGFRCGEGVEQR